MGLPTSGSRTLIGVVLEKTVLHPLFMLAFQRLQALGQRIADLEIEMEALHLEIRRRKMTETMEDPALEQVKLVATLFAV